MDFEARVARVRGLLAERDRIDAELAELLEGSCGKAEGKFRAKRLIAHRAEAGKRGRPKLLTDFAGGKWKCCGSKTKWRHKVGCGKNEGNGRLPPDIKWKCATCGNELWSDGKPETCTCGKPLWVQQ